MLDVISLTIQKHDAEGGLRLVLDKRADGLIFKGHQDLFKLCFSDLMAAVSWFFGDDACI